MFSRSRRIVASVAVLAGLLLTAGTGRADLFTGTLYYTNYAGGGDNVNKVGFSYNDQTHALSFGPQTGVASVFGADGIMFAPNGNLIVTSNATNAVYRIDAGSGSVLQTVFTTNPVDFHMALDPSGTKFYSSDRYTQFAGNLDTFTINPNGSFSNATGTAINGDDPNVTQLAFAPNHKILYTDGSPNAFGSIGLFNLTTNTTTQLIPGGVVAAAHGVIYDPYTGLWTMFGGGSVATMDPNASNIAGSLKQLATGVPDFDQGSVDGFGHALIAGSNGITFIDYSKSHDITHPDFGAYTGGFGFIDDVAPLVGPGSAPSAPEPTGLTLAGLGAVTLLGYARRRRRLAPAA